MSVESFACLVLVWWNGRTESDKTLLTIKQHLSSYTSKDPSVTNALSPSQLAL